MKFLTLIIILICCASCHQVPKKRLSQWDQKIRYEIENDTLFIGFVNPLACPLRLYAMSSHEEVQELLKEDFPALINPFKDTSFSYSVTVTKEEANISFSASMGNPQDSIELYPINLPFIKGATYKIIQGYNGSYSHSDDYSRFSIDFSLSIGDTVCVAADGQVVGVIDGYKYGGKSKKWRDYANYITVFHPDMNIFTQYVHLDHKGSLVKVGDKVKAGQPIGISGMTGYTNIEHLHFNVLKAVQTKEGIASMPIEFKEGYKGKDLKKGSRVTNMDK